MPGKKNQPQSPGLCCELAGAAALESKTSTVAPQQLEKVDDPAELLRPSRRAGMLTATRRSRRDCLGRTKEARQELKKRLSYRPLMAYLSCCSVRQFTSCWSPGSFLPALASRPDAHVAGNQTWVSRFPDTHPMLLRIAPRCMLTEAVCNYHRGA